MTHRPTLPRIFAKHGLTNVSFGAACCAGAFVVPHMGVSLSAVALVFASPGLLEFHLMRRAWSP